MEKVELKNKEVLDGSLIVCRCNEFRLREMHRTLSENPNLSFDRFLRTNELADRCTACLLDLEYLYVQLPRDGSYALTTGQTGSNENKLPIRRKLYQFIDRLSPQRAIRLPNHVPVLLGKNIQQWLWMANHQLDYETSNDVPDFDVELKIYDGDGNKVWDDTRPLVAGSEWREELTQHTRNASVGHLDSGDELSVCWLEVTRRARTDGVRGTTRPQIEIVTPHSSCAVHGQAAGFNHGAQFDLNHCPEEDRIFVSIINIANEPLRAEFRYPIDPLRRLDLPMRVVEVAVPAKGVRLHEIVLGKEEQDAYRNRLFRFSWHGYGKYKAHVFVSSRQLDRFSIDH